LAVALITLIAELWRLTLVMIVSPARVAALAVFQLVLSAALATAGTLGWGLAGALAGMGLGALPCLMILGATMRRVAASMPGAGGAGMWRQLALIVAPCAALAALVAAIVPRPVAPPIADVAWRFAIIALPLAARWRWVAGCLSR
jgi:hypothetical protein